MSSKLLRGHGDYFSDVGGSIGHSLGSLAGSAVGDAISGIGKLFGSGDYTRKPLRVRSNTLTGNQVPKMATRGRLNEFCHREYLGELRSSATATGFEMQKFVINPGWTATFPWLSRIADNFQEYKIHGMVMEFKSNYSDAVVGTGASGTLGTVVIATQYDAGAAEYKTKSAMENAEYSTSGKVSESFLHPIECDMRENPLKVLYIRTGAALDENTDRDNRFSDLGNIFIAASGVQTENDVLGEIWVSYHVSLLKPRITEPGSDAGLVWGSFYWNTGTEFTFPAYFGPGDNPTLVYHPNQTVGHMGVVQTAAELPQVVMAPVISGTGPDLPFGRYIIASFISGVPNEFNTEAEYPGLPQFATDTSLGVEYADIFGPPGEEYSTIISPVYVNDDSLQVQTMFCLTAFDLDPTQYDVLNFSPGQVATAELPGPGSDGANGQLFVIGISPEWTPAVALDYVKKQAGKRGMFALLQMLQNKTSSISQAFAAASEVHSGTKVVRSTKECKSGPAPKVSAAPAKVKLPPKVKLAPKVAPKVESSPLKRTETVKVDNSGQLWQLVTAPKEEKKEEKKV